MVEGEKDQVEDLIGRLKEGSPMARVEDVDVDWEDYKGEFTDFRITWSGI